MLLHQKVEIAGIPSGVGENELWRGQITELDGLRGISILLVLLHHFWDWPAGGMLSDLVHTGWVGVDLFFAISGFLITGILLDTKGHRNFYASFYSRRALRIFPLYYAFIAASFILIPLLEAKGNHQSSFLRDSGSPLWYLFYLGNVREAILGKEPSYVLAPLWSLSIEEQFYIVFPFIVAMLSRDSLRRVLWSLLILAPAIRILFLLYFPDNERIQYLATPCRMDVIAVGALLAIHIRAGKIQPSPTRTAIIAAALVAICGFAFANQGLNRTEPFCRSFGYSLIAVTAGAVVYWAVQHRGQPQARLLRCPALCGLGKICYGVYLLQRPVEVVVLKTVSRFGVELSGFPVLSLLLKCSAAVGVAALSWHIFERRLLRLKKYFSLPTHPVDSTGFVAREDNERPSVREPLITMSPSN